MKALTTNDIAPRKIDELIDATKQAKGTDVPFASLTTTLKLAEEILRLRKLLFQVEANRARLEVIASQPLLQLTTAQTDKFNPSTYAVANG